MASTEPVMLPELDSPPKVWVDSHDILANLTPEEMAQGGELGRLQDEEPPPPSSRGFAATAPLPMSAARSLREALLDHGAGRIVSPYTGKVGGVSLALLRTGRGTGGRFVARLHHHTASASISRTALTPALAIVRNGRPDLQGPLANGYGGGDFIYRLVTFDWANHPGLGGPLAFSKGTVPKDNGRPYLWGTEWDWNGISAWPDEYLEWMAVCDAGLADYHGLLIEDQGEHKTWAPTRKVDRNIITRSSSITRTRKVFNLYKTNPIPEETFMAGLNDQQQIDLKDAVDDIDRRTNWQTSLLLELCEKLGVKIPPYAMLTDKGYPDVTQTGTAQQEIIHALSPTNTPNS